MTTKSKTQKTQKTQKSQNSPAENFGVIINPDLATLIEQKFSTPIRPQNLVPVNRYNGPEKDIAQAFTEYTPDHPYTEPQHVSNALASRVRGFDIHDVVLKKAAQQPVRPSVMHAVHLVFGGNLLPPGVSGHLGKSGFKVYIVPNGTSPSHENPQLSSFLQNQNPAVGGILVNGNGVIHDSQHTDIPTAHKETVANVANVSGQHLYNTLETAAISRLPAFIQAAQQLGFSSPAEFMGHLIRHHALSLYGAASELGDEAHNIYGGSTIVDSPSHYYNFLAFLDVLNKQHPALGNTLFHVLHSAGILPAVEDIQKIVRGEPLDAPSGYKLGQSVGLPQYNETDDEDAAAAEAAAGVNLHGGKLNVLGTPRNSNVLAAKQKLAEYAASKGMKDHLNDFTVNLHGPDSPHHIMSYFSHNNPNLPTADSDLRTGLKHSEITDKSRELNILSPTQNKENASRETGRIIEDEIGRHLFAKNGGFHAQGTLQNSPAANLGNSASLLTQIVPPELLNDILQFPLLPHKEEVSNSPEYKAAKGISPPQATTMMGTGAETFNNLFKFAHNSLIHAVNNGMPNDSKTRFIVYKNFVDDMKQKFLQNKASLRGALEQLAGNPISADRLLMGIQEHLGNILGNFQQIMQQYV